MEFKLEEKPEWGELATFVPNKKDPVYNWFYYKEGFSRELVFKVVEMFGLTQNALVLDPFCGSGTTLLACKQLGINSVGFDVLPISVFSSTVKTRDYDTEALREHAKTLLRTKFRRFDFDVPSIVRRAFNKYALEDTIFFRHEINKIEDEKARDFFLLSLMNAAMKISYAWKDGAVIKIRKKHTPPLRKFFNRTIYKMISELDNFQKGECETIVNQCDARRMNLDDNSVDAVITSPPYLNQIDYIKVYEIENFILGGLPKPPIRSFVGFGEDIEVTNKLPYFDDMNMVLKELHRVCKPGANVAIVVGNGYINREIIESDIRIAELAESIGFTVEKIYVLNKRFALEERTKKKGILRESMIVLKK